MNKISFVLICIMAGLLTACDAKDDLNKPQTMVRTMVIGGVPVADHDYQSMAREQKPHVDHSQP
ncbi:hypothetical protein E0H82_00945 [Acinetobacter sp. ANC 4910]|uniref:NF038215 family lipoprotein n=1 Tax=Acinetobacter sp. ANC 4910 TaxID=2529850 RepID=UPI00103A3A52|nr:NF038215 family lipoprotein [Acinetobacter sp. ANC 4910]TCB38190.1 hypothetical protein E0H82_00945 [Acinetobacter sp. ANC 4910]